MPDLIALILDTYLEIKHWIKHNKQRKLEKENNLPKSIVWHPMTKPLLFFFLIITPFSFMLFFFTNINKNKEKTEERMLEISRILEAEKKEFGKHPSDLKDIIRNNPLRKNIALDFWKSPFVYTVSEDGKNYQLISIGGDGELNTKDDISYTKK